MPYNMSFTLMILAKCHHDITDVILKDVDLRIGDQDQY